MDEQECLRVANFRYGLIAPMVTRELAPGEQARMLRETAARRYQAPHGKVNRVSVRTLERYLRAYRTGGLEALKPSPRRDREQARAITPEILEKAAALRREVPTRSLRQIIAILELSGEVAPGTLKRSTLARHLEHLATRKAQAKAQAGFRRFEAPCRNAVWQGDCQHTLYLPDPDHPGRKRQVYLIAFIDDYSRLITHGQFYLEENRPRLEDALKKAIMRYGVPQRLYVDNGSIYSSDHLARICGELRIHLVHSLPYRPEGRGKIEKWFQYVDRSFKPEAYALINAAKLLTLEQLNDFFWAWLEVAYHQRKHSSTKQTPRARFAKDQAEIRRVDPDHLRQVFLWQETRTVDKTGCLSLFGNTYEVDSALARKTVTLRYDPYDLRQIQVFFQGQPFPDAVPLKLQREHHQRVKPREEPPPPPTGLNYLELARKKHQQDLKDALGKLNYRTIIKDGDPR